MFFFFKQKTAYEMRISDWSSDVCSSDLTLAVARARHRQPRVRAAVRQVAGHGVAGGTWAPGARRGAVTAGGRAVLRRERPGTDEARIAFGHALHRRPDRHHLRRRFRARCTDPRRPHNIARTAVGAR